MSIYADTTELKKLFEAEPVFKPATPANLVKREAERKAELKKRIEDAKKKNPNGPWVTMEAGTCPYCGSEDVDFHDMEEDESGISHEFTCGDCGASGFDEYNKEYVRTIVYDPPEKDNVETFDDQGNRIV